METIAQQIVRQRKESKMSQNDLRITMGFKSIQAITSWEKGRVEPSINQVAELHEKLGWEFTAPGFKS